MILTEEQQLMVNIAKDFAVNELRPRLKEIEETDSLPKDLFDRAAELGFRGIMVPEEWGGLGAGVTTQVLVMEELAKEHLQGGSLANNTLAAVVLSAGTPFQKEKYLRRLAAGEFSIGLGFTEASAGSDASAIQTTAVKDGDDWVLNGTKIFISRLKSSDAFLVSALTNETAPGGISSFIVEKSFPGITIGAFYPKLGLHGSETGELYLKNCRVPAENMIGAENHGLSVVLKTLSVGRLKMAALALGNAQSAYEKAVAYAKQRVQFGKPIAKLQVIQHYAADMLAELEASRALIYSAAAKADAGVDIALDASICKLWVTEMGSRVTDKAVQICGGYGLIEDGTIERHYRDARVLRIVEGTSEIQKLIIARSIFPK